MSSVNYPNCPHLTVADPKRSIRFYEKLGFELESSWPDAKAPVWASLVLDRQVVMIGSLPSEKDAKQMGAGKGEQRRIKKEHKAFKKHRHGVGVQHYVSVPDVDAHHRSAQRRKVEVLRPPTSHFYGLRDWVAVDPDGHQLVFFAPVEAEDELEPAPRKKRRKAAVPVASEVVVAEPAAEPVVAPQ